MDINQIKELCEVYYNVSLSNPCRNNHYTKARRVFCYVANKICNHSEYDISEAMSRDRRTVLHHIKQANNFISLGYTDLTDDINNIYGIDVLRRRKNNKIESIIKDLNIDSIPEDKIQEFKERVNLIIKGYEFRTTSRPSI